MNLDIEKDKFNVLSLTRALSSILFCVFIYIIKMKSFFVSPLWVRIFNKSNFIKIIVIFIIGFIVRVLIATYFVNVFLEFENYISVACYFFITSLATMFNKFITYFNFSIIPVNFGYLKLSFIKDAISYYFNYNKVKLSNFDSNIKNYNTDYNSYKTKLYNFNSSENTSNFDKFRNKSKRVLFWVLWEKYINNYDSYKTYKETWDPNLKVRTIIKKDVNDGIWKVKVFKNTAKRIWNSVFS